MKSKEELRKEYNFLHDDRLGELDEVLLKDLKEIVSHIEMLGTARISGVFTRKKDFDSLWEKFKRNPNSEMMEEPGNLLTMEDIVGGKIIVLNECDLEVTKEIVKKGMLRMRWGLVSKTVNGKVVEIKDYVLNRSVTGHRAYHLYFKKILFLSEFESFSAYAEVQILTETADFWARWTHFLNYKASSVGNPTRVEESMFMNLSKRLENIDHEANELRLELEFFRPAYPKNILGAPPKVSSIVEKPQLRNIALLTPNLKWLGVFPDKLAPENVYLGYNEKNEQSSFGFSSRKFELGKKLEERAFMRTANEMGMPDAIALKAFYLLREIYANSSNLSSKLHNGDLARLEAFTCSAKSLSLWFRKTSYWTLLLTNLALDRSIPSVCGIDCRDLSAELWKHISKAGTNTIGSSSIFANNLAVHVTLKTGDGQLVVTKRGSVGVQEGLWSNSASGDMLPRHWTIDKRADFIPLTKGDRNQLAQKGFGCGTVVSPFLAAARELSEELGVHVPLKNFRLQALVLSGEHLQPILLFETETPLSFGKLVESASNARDSAEIEWDNREFYNDGGLSIGGRNAYFRALPASKTGLQQLRDGFGDMPGIVENLDSWQEKAVASLLLAFPSNAWN